MPRISPSWKIRIQDGGLWKLAQEGERPSPPLRPRMSRSVCQSCRETNGQQKARRLLFPRSVSPDGLINRANIHPLSPLQPPLLFSSLTNKKSCHLDRCTTIVVWHILRPQNVPLPNLGGGPTPTACQQCVLGSPLFSSVVTVSTGHCHTVIGGKRGCGS